MNVNAKYDHVAGIGVVALCVYETTAMITGRPTVSAMCRRYRGCEVTLLIILLAHLHIEHKRDDELSEVAGRYNFLRDIHLAYQRYLIRGRPQ
jgi:hypothetical protein